MDHTRSKTGRGVIERRQLRQSLKRKAGGGKEGKGEGEEGEGEEREEKEKVRGKFAPFGMVWDKERQGQRRGQGRRSVI